MHWNAGARIGAAETVARFGGIGTAYIARAFRRQGRHFIVAVLRHGVSMLVG